MKRPITPRGDAMTLYVLQVIGADGEIIGYLSEVDFEANGPRYPTGHAEWIADPDLALQFASQAEAICFLMTRSKSCPLRPDGHPNRPLRAFNIGVVELNPICH